VPVVVGVVALSVIVVVVPSRSPASIDPGAVETTAPISSSAGAPVDLGAAAREDVTPTEPATPVVAPMPEGATGSPGASRSQPHPPPGDEGGPSEPPAPPTCDSLLVLGVPLPVSLPIVIPVVCPQTRALFVYLGVFLP
jgi:hypothetical protein